MVQSSSRDEKKDRGMDKDYLKWMPIKVEINNKTVRSLNFKERDIWICNVGENIGFEEDGKGGGFSRPVLVVKKFGRNMCFIVPLSTTKKRGWFYHPFDGHTGTVSVVLLSQARVVDSLRLRRKIGFASENDFSEITTRLKEVFGL
jgi:mRNA-degrading endonuclease toxin of MazEF toxin-antitoxin module